MEQRCAREFAKLQNKPNHPTTPKTALIGAV